MMPSPDHHLSAVLVSTSLICWGLALSLALGAVPVCSTGRSVQQRSLRPTTPLRVRHCTWWSRLACTT